MSTTGNPNCDSSPSAAGDVNSVVKSTNEASDKDSVHWSITLQERLAGNLGQVTCHSVTAKTRPSVSVRDLKVQAMTLLQVNSVPADTVRSVTNTQVWMLKHQISVLTYRYNILYQGLWRL